MFGGHSQELLKLVGIFHCSSMKMFSNIPNLYLLNTQSLVQHFLSTLRFRLCLITFAICKIAASFFFLEFIFKHSFTLLSNLARLPVRFSWTHTCEIFVARKLHSPLREKYLGKSRNRGHSPAIFSQ